MDVAQHMHHGKFPNSAWISRFQCDGRNVAGGHHPKRDVVGQQCVMAAPSPQGNAQVGRREGCARQHAVAAPGQAAVECAQSFIIECLHGRTGQHFELTRCDAGGIFCQLAWRDLRQFQYSLRTMPVAVKSRNNASGKCHWRGGDGLIR